MENSDSPGIAPVLANTVSWDSWFGVIVIEQFSDGSCLVNGSPVETLEATRVGLYKTQANMPGAPSGRIVGGTLDDSIIVRS